MPKESGGFRPALDLRVINHALHKLPFKMLTQKRIFGCVHHPDWFVAIDLKNAYSHVLTLLRHRPFLRFAFDGRHISTRSCPSGNPCRLVSSPKSWRLCSPERTLCVLNYLDDWLMLAHSQEDGGPTETFSEAPGTTSALAPWPSPEVGVETRYSPG